VAEPHLSRRGAAVPMVLSTDGCRSVRFRAGAGVASTISALLETFDICLRIEDRSERFAALGCRNVSRPAI